MLPESASHAWGLPGRWGNFLHSSLCYRSLVALGPPWADFDHVFYFLYFDALRAVGEGGLLALGNGPPRVIQFSELVNTWL